MKPKILRIGTVLLVVLLAFLPPAQAPQGARAAALFTPYSPSIGFPWSALGGGLNDAVKAIAVEGADVYAGGSFTDAGGNANADGIARWDGAAWQALGGGLNNTVNAIAVAGSNVYAGGAFTNAGGDPNADYIARWDGSAGHAVGSTPMKKWV